jgi:hypothetical protein
MPGQQGKKATTAKKKADTKASRSPRIKSINLVSFARHNEVLKLDEDGGVARTVNLSKSGVLLETYTMLPVGSVLEIDLSLGDRLVTLAGEVIRAEPDKGFFRLGIKFLDSSGTPGGRKAVEDYLSARKS